MASPAVPRLAVPHLVVALALLAGGCAAKAPSNAAPGPAPKAPSSAGAGTSATGGTGTATASPTGPGVRTVVVSVRGNQVSPAPSRVNLATGQTLRVVVTSDRDDTVHAHGFDVEKPLLAGRPTTLLLTGGAPGQYEVETHHLGLRLLVVLVR